MEGISLTSLTLRDFRGEAEKNRDPTGLAQSRKEEQAKSWVAKKACDQLGYFATTEKELKNAGKIKEETKKQVAESYARKQREEKERQR